jgi:colanic acid biosynthesis glycosyl transferase WcaI
MAPELAQHPKKFVFVNRYFDPDQSASSQMLSDLARGLAARARLVHVVCSRQLYDDSRAGLPPHEVRSGVTIHRVATTRFGRAGLIGRAADYASFYVSAGLTLLRLLRAGDVVIAKTDPPLISILAAGVARVKGTVLINWQQDVYPEVASHLQANPLPRWLDSQLRKLRDWSLRRAKMNVLISNRMLGYFQQRGIPRPQLCVIDNWADAEAIAPKPAGSSVLRARLGLADRFVVSYSGNLGRAHEFNTFLAAADAMRSESSIAFLIIGGGAKMESLRREVAKRGLENFLFLPYQRRDDLEDSLAAADVHLVSLLPALQGLIMPSKVFGILAAGRPLLYIGDSHCDIARVIAETGCGVSVAVDAVKDLVAAIRWLKSEPNVCADMGARAREIFLRRYTMQNAIERWISVLDCGPHANMLQTHADVPT